MLEFGETGVGEKEIPMKTKTTKKTKIMFAPDPTGTVKCGFACHTKVAAKDSIFTAHGTR